MVRDVLSGKTATKERLAKLVEELRGVLGERDEARREAATRALELSDAWTSLADDERREAAVRETYREMSVAAYRSMVSL